MPSRVAVMAVPGDRILGRLAPLGMGAAIGTCLVIDLVETVIRPGVPTLASLHESGLRRSHLEPSRSGVAVVSRGDLNLQPALALTEELARHWPALVIRTAGADEAGGFGQPFSVRLLVPEVSADGESGRVVWQRLSSGQRPPGPSLPPIGRGRAWQMLRGTVSPSWRWVRAWDHVWRLV